jgi:hypothetical protein
MIDLSALPHAMRAADYEYLEVENFTCPGLLQQALFVRFELLSGGQDCRPVLSFKKSLRNDRRRL